MHGVQGVVGSNPAVPTYRNRSEIGYLAESGRFFVFVEDEII